MLVCPNPKGGCFKGTSPGANRSQAKRLEKLQFLLLHFHFLFLVFLFCFLPTPSLTLRPCPNLQPQETTRLRVPQSQCPSPNPHMGPAEQHRAGFPERLAWGQLFPRTQMQDVHAWAPPPRGTVHPGLHECFGENPTTPQVLEPQEMPPFSPTAAGGVLVCPLPPQTLTAPCREGLPSFPPHLFFFVPMKC